MILDPCTWVSEGFLLAIGGFPQEYHLRPSPGVLISSLEGAWVVLDGMKKSRLRIISGQPVPSSGSKGMVEMLGSTSQGLSSNSLSPQQGK